MGLVRWFRPSFPNLEGCPNSIEDFSAELSVLDETWLRQQVQLIVEAHVVAARTEICLSCSKSSKFCASVNLNQQIRGGFKGVDFFPFYHLNEKKQHKIQSSLLNISPVSPVDWLTLETLMQGHDIRKFIFQTMIDDFHIIFCVFL